MSVYRQTDKAKAMMAARLIADIDAAPILTSSMVRAATEAAHSLQEWVLQSNNIEEVNRAASLAAQRLRSIEQKGRSILSTPIASDVLAGLHRELQLVRAALLRKSRTDGEAGEEDLDDAEEEFTTGTDSKTKDGEVLMPRDVELSMKKSTLHFYILFFVLTVIFVAGSAAIILVQEHSFLDKTGELQLDVTMLQALISQQALNMLYDAMVAKGDNVKSDGVTRAAALLGDMTRRMDASQSIISRSENHICEYRAAVQDFANSNQVTLVGTPRAFGALCQTNLTYPIHRINDIKANQTFVVPVVTPNSCANDATSTGIFSFIIPSYLSFTPYVETYRRNLARLVSYYHSGFGISVAVTHDRMNLQDYLTPPVTLIGHTEPYVTEAHTWKQQMALWCGLAIGVTLCAQFLALSFMMGSQKVHWKRIYCSIILVVFLIGLTAVYLVSQAVLSTALNSAILRVTYSLIVAVTGASLSPTMLKYNLMIPFFLALSEGLLRDRLLVTNVGATIVVPASMKPVADHINAARISNYQRGSYSDFEGDYAVSSSYINATGWNFIVTRKLLPRFHADSDIAIIFVTSVVGALVLGCYTRWSPLVRLRRFGLASPLLHFHVEPTRLRILFYVVLIICSVVGIICVNLYGVIEMRKQMTKFSQDSLVLLGGCLQSHGIKDHCTNHCGMPDFTTILYFRSTKPAGATYNEIRFILQNMPLPYPMQSDWVTHYLGAELSMNNIYTTLVNVPSFATPLVNRTTNATDPRYILRHMMSTARINDTVGFAIERFPDSYYPKTYSFNTTSIGVCTMLIICAAIITVCELEYITLHDAYQRGLKLPRRSFITLVMAMLFVPIGFICHGGVMRFEVEAELHQFALQELAFLGSAVNFRMSITSLDLIGMSTFDEVVERLCADAMEASTAAMLIGTVFFRVRIAQEVPERGSDTVLIHGVAYQEPVNIGPLDQGEIPVCGRFAPKYVSDHSEGDMNYCYMEIPQSTALTNPRLFLLATSGHRLWVNLPTAKIWGKLFGMAALMGSLVTCVVGLVLFFVLHTAHNFGYPLMLLNGSLPFTDPVPKKFTKEFFIPRQQRLLWVGSLLLLSFCLVYYSVSVGEFLSVINKCRRVQVSYESQDDLFVSVTSEALCHAYNFILFPFPSVTTDRLLALGKEAEAGTGAYTFVTSEGLEAFYRGVLNTYLNLTNTDNALNALLGAAFEGYGSYTSYIAGRYESVFIDNQENTFDAITTLVDTMETETSGLAVMNYPSCISFLREVSILRDLMRKLFILDHIAVASYASFSYSNSGSWPFSDQQAPIIIATRNAAKALEELVTASITNLKNIATMAVPSAKSTFDDIIDKVTETFAASYAVSSFTAPIWTLQRKRCAEAVSVGNTTQETIAGVQQARELASIGYLNGNITIALDYELTARKTRQMMEHIRGGVSLDDEMPMLTWQRWNKLKEIERMAITSFVCTIATMLIVAASILLHFKLMRRKTDMMQEELKRSREAGTVEASGIQPPLSSIEEDSDAHLHKAMEPKKLEESASSLEKNGAVEKGMVYSQHAQLSDSGSLVGDSSVPLTRSKRWVTVPVGCLLLVSFVPFVCSFWLLILAHRVSKGRLRDISIILSLYTKAQTIFTELENLMQKTVLYYLGSMTKEDYLAFIRRLQDATLELGSAYQWAMGSTSLTITDLYEAFNLMHAALTYELDQSDNIVSSGQMSPYYATQSSYARTMLPTLTSASTYGVLLPMSVTTDGSEMNTFAEAYFQAKSAAVVGADKITFRKAYQEYALVVDAFDKASSAELMMWHATVAGAREEGASVAVSFGGFTNLIGAGPLAALVTAKDPSGKAAADAVMAHFKDLLDNYGTSMQQTTLFTKTETAPSNAATSPLGAYEAAGYVSSYLTSTTTEGKFANIFGYNRNLTSVSSALQGRTTLLDRYNNYNDAVRNVLFTLGNGELRAFPAVTNLWIWYLEMKMDEKPTHDHQDLNYLSDAIWWCLIVSFWGLLAAMFAAFYLSYLKW